MIEKAFQALQIAHRHQQGILQVCGHHDGHGDGRLARRLVH
jgi:hypothetical protein